MTRKEFIEKSITMGIGIPMLSQILIQSCTTKNKYFNEYLDSFGGKVIIIGAGAAGMAAAYLMKKHNVDFQILEASSNYGGRIKKSKDFTDFPIDLGAEWIHVNPEILEKLSNKKIDKYLFETMVYNPQTIKTYKDGKLQSHNYVKHLYSEWKFQRATWFDFFNENIVPEIKDHILIQHAVKEIDYSGEKIRIKTVNNDSFICDKVLVTSSIKVLQNNVIQFKPELPHEKKSAINKVNMNDGIKIFIEFKEKFYPDILSFGNIFEALDSEDKFVYDAAFKKETQSNVLGLFAINKNASRYTQLESEQEMINEFLTELDTIFEGKASKNYIKHIVQNWSKEPYIQGSYSYNFDGKKNKIKEIIKEPILNKIYFAGEALSKNNQAMVQGACETGYQAVLDMFK